MTILDVRSLRTGLPSRPEAEDVAALFNAVLGDGTTAGEILALAGRGCLVRSIGPEGLLGAASARILSAADTAALAGRLRAAGSSVTLPERVVELKSGAVAPGARGLGLGTALTDELLRYARRTGCRYAVSASWVSADPAHASLGLLERAGFTRAAVLSGYWSEETGPANPCPDCGDACVCAAIIMILDLDAHEPEDCP